VRQAPWCLRGANRCLTPRSRRGPTAGHQARSGGTRYIVASPGLAPRRRPRLTSNVRRHKRDKSADRLPITTIIMRRLIGLLFAFATLASLGIGISLVRDPSSSGQLRLFGLICICLAVGLGIVSVAVLAAPISFRRDSSFKALAVALLFLAVGVLMKACSK